jgi:integrase
MSQLTVSTLRHFVRDQTADCAPATRNKLIRTLRAIFQWAVPELLQDNPARAVHFVEEPERDKRTLTPEEFFQLLRGIDDRDQAVVIFGTCCGLRREEIACLRWHDIDLETAMVRVRNSEWHVTKSGRQRAVLMPPALISVLKRLRTASASSFVFGEVYTTYHELPNSVKREWSQCYQESLRQGLDRPEARAAAWHAVQKYQRPQQPINANRLTDLVPRLIRKAGIPHCTLHDLRRTFCTYLAACGTDPLAAQKLAGHSSPTVTARHYVGLVPQMLNSQRLLPFWRPATAQLLGRGTAEPAIGGSTDRFSALNEPLSLED